MKVLIVEDDRLTREGLAEVLQGEGYHVTCASNGQEALDLFAELEPDFVCLDIMMPEVSGYDVCKRIRSGNETTPIVFISAKSEEIDKVVGLELGADDFIVKPFGVREVIARIRAVTRRCHQHRSREAVNEFFEMCDLRVYPKQLRASRGDLVIDLSLRDTQILELLHRHRGRVVDRRELFEACWGMDYLPNSRTLDQHISQLRKRVELNAKQPQLIRTVHGVGYRYDG